MTSGLTSWTGRSCAGSSEAEEAVGPCSYLWYGLQQPLEQGSCDGGMRRGTRDEAPPSRVDALRLASHHDTHLATMMETDAGDFAINDSAAVAVAPKAQRAAGPQGPIFRVSPKLEVSPPSLQGPTWTVRCSAGL